MILAILFAVLGYRKAADTGRNKALWALLMVVIFIGVQVAAGLVSGVGIGLGVAMFGWSETIFEDFYWPISIAGAAMGAAVCAGILYLLGRSAKIEEFELPPPPTKFGLG